MKAEKELFEKKEKASKSVKDEEDTLEVVSECDLEKDDNQNLVFNIPISNKFDILAKSLSTAHCLPSLPVTPTHRTAPPPTTPKRSKTSAPSIPLSPRTPPLPGQDQFERSFRNFLDEFRDHDQERKFLKQVREKIAIRSNFLSVSILDIWQHNQLLASEISANYWKMLPALNDIIRSFMTANFKNSEGRNWSLTICNRKAIDNLSLLN